MLQCSWRLQHRTGTAPSASTASTSTSIRLLQALRSPPSATVSSIVNAAEAAGRHAYPRRRKLFEDGQLIELDETQHGSNIDSADDSPYTLQQAEIDEPVVPPLTFQGRRQPMYSPDIVSSSTAGSMRALPGHTGSMHGHADQHHQPPKVHVFWDVDNTHPDWVPPEDMVQNIRSALSGYGEIASMHAYANQNTARWVPPSVAEERRMARQDMKAEARAFARGEKSLRGRQGHRCEMCGAGFPTAEKLQRHFFQLHEREFNKRQAHKRPNKKISAKEKAKVQKYLDAREKAVRTEIKKEIGLDRRLRSCGVKVTIVPNRPQAADSALLRSADRVLASLGAGALPVAGQQQQGQQQGQQRQQQQQQHGAQRGEHEGAAGPRAVLCVISDDRGLVKCLLRACEAAWCALVVICARPSDMAEAMRGRQGQDDPGTSHLGAILDFCMVQNGEYVVPARASPAAQQGECTLMGQRRLKRGLAVCLVPQRVDSSPGGAVRRLVVWRLQPVAVSTLCQERGEP